MTFSAFILAAGLGERLLPITRHIPKPLLPVLGKPVLEYVLDKIMDVPMKNMGINLHHKKTDIEQWITSSAYSKTITMFPEDPILGTGGALKNAQDFLKYGPFLVHNADILSNVDLGELLQLHISSGNIATLAVHNRPEFNSLLLDSEGFLMDIVKHPHPNPPPSREREGTENAPPIKNSDYLDSLLLTSKGGHADNFPSTGRRGLRGGGIQSERFVAFTGIAAYQPQFLELLPKGNSSVVDAWFKAVSAGYRIGTVDVTGCYWTDIGTPAAYASAVIHAMRQNGENVYIHQSTEGCGNASLDGYIVIEKDSVIKQGVSLRNCISLPGTMIGKISCDESSAQCFLTRFWGAPDAAAPKKSFENCILGPDFIIQINESNFGVTAETTRSFIGTGGSDRKYFRIKKSDRSAVLMQCAENDPDFQRHIELTKFFRRLAAPVPELLSADNQSQTALFEDLGDISLYSWLKCPRSEGQKEEIYRRALDILVSIQSTATAHADQCPALQARIFDYEHLRWETSYFLERFVRGMMHREIQNRELLENEFHQLALLVDSFPKTIVHRDFQSQNIMIARDGMPRILDYQGARMGPPAYDVVSLLWDPYHRLDINVRQRLLEYYLGRVSYLRYFGKEFPETLLPCRLQRHMQALGAYGFLATVKGKTYFQKHIPEGIRLLKEDISETGHGYPALRNLVMEL